MKTHKLILALCLFPSAVNAWWGSKYNITEITPDELEEGIQNGFFNVVVDARTEDEWDKEGHIPEATLVDTLPIFPIYISHFYSADALRGCEKCNIAVYCKSGQRADTALQFLAQNGFESLFDAAGIKQWTESGRDLVNTTSKVATCALDSTETC